MSFLAPPEPPGEREFNAVPAQAQPVGKKFDLADLKQYVHLVVRRIWLVALCFVISLGIAVYTMMQQVDTYRATAQIVITTSMPLGAGLQISDRDQFRGLPADYLATQQQILNSPIVASRAKQKLAFSPSAISESIQRLRVFPLWQTTIIAIEVTSLDPQIGADYANAIAEAYIEFKDDELLDMSQQSILALTQQANRLREELRSAEDDLLAFRRDNRIVALAQRGNIAEQTMGELAQRAARLRMDRLFLQNQQPMLHDASYDAVIRTLTLSSPSVRFESLGNENLSSANMTTEDADTQQLMQQGVIVRPSWEQLRKEKAMLDSEIDLLRRSMRDSHPRVQEALRRASDLDRRMAIELDFARQQFSAQLEALEIQEQAALRVEQTWEEEALETSRKAIEYANLERERGRLQRLYDLMYDRLRELDVAATHQTENIRILQEASPASRPVQPRKLQNLFLAALLGIGVGLGLVFGLEFIDDSLRYPDDATRSLQLPLFGVVPSADWDPDDLTSHLLSTLEPSSGLTEAYRNVRSSLMVAASRSTMQSMAFLSAVPKEGKTTTALNVAISLTQAGLRILLVDADLRRGELHKYFGLDGGRGLSDVLTGHAKPESVVQRSGIAGLDLIATGPFPPNPAELTLRPEFKAFLEYAKRNYDHVILDCPPVLAVSESATLASMVDHVIFVVWGGHTPRKVAQTSVRLLQEKGAHLIGCILNNLELGRVGYYYYSGYYYDAYYREEHAAKTEV